MGNVDLYLTELSGLGGSLRSTSVLPIQIIYGMSQKMSPADLL